jgi:hypothetical protein
LRDEKRSPLRKIARNLRGGHSPAQAAHGAKHDKLAAKIAALEAQLAEAEENRRRATSMAQLNRAGHVYVISNVGSFGDDVYKIGMTRRLEPQDRVDELGDASVPFRFDVHAMIYSQDAPALEAAIHRYFHERRVNKVNGRKEFFKATLDEIHQIVAHLHGHFRITKIAEALEFRRTLAIEAGHQPPVLPVPMTPTPPPIVFAAS